jgi:hypothetical protein
MILLRGIGAEIPPSRPQDITEPERGTMMGVMIDPY